MGERARSNLLTVPPVKGHIASNSSDGICPALVQQTFTGLVLDDEYSTKKRAQEAAAFNNDSLEDVQETAEEAGDTQIRVTFSYLF